MRSLWFLLLIFFPLLTQGQEAYFRHVTSPEALRNQTVNCIIKDQKGYMWFGGYDGLLKYDGYSITKYLTQYNDPDFGEKADVRILEETNDGTLLAGTFFGLCVYNRNTDTFKRYVSDKKNSKSLGHNHILSIYKDKKGRIWVGTMQGLDLFNSSSGTFIHYYPFKNKGDFVAAISEDSKGNLWLYGGTEICCFNLQTEQCTYVQVSQNPELKDAFVLQGIMVVDRKDRVWLGNKVEGLIRYDSRLGDIAKYNTVNKKIPSNLVSYIYIDMEENIWVGSDDNGLFKYNPETEGFFIFTNNPNKSSSISRNTIHTLYESEPGNLWIGLYAGGVDVLNKNNKRFIKITSKGEKQHVLSNKSVLALEENKGKILIGTDGGGLNILNLKTANITAVSNDMPSVVKSLYSDSTGNTWLGTYRSGLYLLDKNNKIVKTYRTGESVNAIRKNNVWALAKATKGSLFIGLLSGGLDILDSTGVFMHYPFDSIQPHHAPCNIQVLFEDSQKRIWIGTEAAGVLLYNTKDNSFTHIYKSKDGKEFLTNISDIFEDSKGNIWLGTRGGGLKKLLKDKENEWKTFSVKQGLLADEILNILEDNRGNLWLTSDSEIICFKVKEGKFIVFGKEDGVLSGFNSHSKLKSTQGRMFFGSSNGLNSFYPDSIEFNENPPPVEIIGLKIFNQPVKPNIPFKGKFYLKKAINLSPAVSLNYEDNVFSIEFAALSFTAPGKNTYAYKLVGFDENWTFVNADKRFANYTNLNPGTYTFKVIAANSVGVWNKQGASLQIKILPPWWFTWWFKSFLAFLAAIAVVLIVYLRTRAIRKKNAFLEAEIEKQTSKLQKANIELLEKNKEVSIVNADLVKAYIEISLKSEHIEKQQQEIILQKEKLLLLNKNKEKIFSILAHDLKNPVLAISALSKLLKTELQTAPDMQKKIVRHIELSADRTQSLLLNLLDWILSQKENINLRTEKIPVKKLLFEVAELYSSMIFQKQIALDFQIKEALFVFADYNSTSAIVRNLINNAIKFTPKGGVITLGASRVGEGTVLITVKDTGVGMSEDAIHKFLCGNLTHSISGTENETGTGLGFTIIREFTALNKGKILVEASPGEGSCFQLHLPGEKLMVSTELEVEKQEDVKSVDVLIKESYLGKKVLIVDDDEQVRDAIARILASYFEVHQCGNIEEALLLCEKVIPDLIITDISMPGESGINLCQTVKNNRLTSHIPVMLITAQPTEELHGEGLKAGADAFIAKPFDRNIFLSTINNLIASIENIKLQFTSDTASLPKEYTRNKLDEEFINKLIKAVEQAISMPDLNGDNLAKELGISKSILYAKLKTITGQTVNEFIRIIRIKKSTDLLLEGRLNITEISIEMGFNSASYYTKSFRKYYACSPKEFIAKHLIS